MRKISEIINSAKKKLEKPRVLYHGSDVKVTVLKPAWNFNNRQTKKIRGVFATDFERAKMFAIYSAFKGEGFGNLSSRNKTMLVENIKETIGEEFYIYTVDADGFVLDDSKPEVGEYYIENKDVKIKDMQVFDTAAEIKKAGWRIYRLVREDEFLRLEGTDEESNNVKARRTGKDREIDIIGRIAAQRAARMQKSNQRT